MKQHMEIKLINSEEFYITQQDKVLYKIYLGTYNGISIKSVGSPDFEYYRGYILFLRGTSEYRDTDSVKVPRNMMKQVLTALGMCCIEYGVTLTLKL